MLCKRLYAIDGTKNKRLKNKLTNKVYGDVGKIKCHAQPDAMPLNIESDCPGGAEEILRELAPFLKGQAALDTAQLG